MLAGKETCVGFDVGKSAHRACAVSRSSGKVLFDVPVDNRADPIDGIPARGGRGPRDRGPEAQHRNPRA